MKKGSKTFLTRALIISLFTAVIAGSWDAWWHGAIGRNTFWEPPHILLYLSIVVTIGLGFLGWYLTRERLWKKAAIVLFLVPLSGPFDEFWHRAFGIENLSSPFIVWSPPHLMLIFSVIASFIFLLRLLRHDQNLYARRFFGAMIFAGVLTLALFVVSPFDPVGAYKVLGFWGAGLTSGVFLAVLMRAQQWLPGLARATETGIFFILLSSIGFTERLAPKLIIPPHDHPPSWLIIFTYLAGAITLDITKKLPLWSRGIIAGFAYGALFYFVANIFFEPIFRYTMLNTLTAISATSFGGLIAGLLMHLKRLG